jgi:hypothetical protein
MIVMLEAFVSRMGCLFLSPIVQPATREWYCALVLRAATLGRAACREGELGYT